MLQNKGGQSLNEKCYLRPIHVVTFTLRSILVTDYIKKKRPGSPLLFSFEYNLLPNLISK